jgi:hypothetical protein
MDEMIINLVVLKIFIILFTVVRTVYRFSTIMNSSSVRAKKIQVPIMAVKGAAEVFSEPKRISTARNIDIAITMKSLTSSVRKYSLLSRKPGLNGKSVLSEE